MIFVSMTLDSNFLGEGYAMVEILPSRREPMEGSRSVRKVARVDRVFGESECNPSLNPKDRIIH